MKRILLLAAGAIGTAGMIALAAPASAEEPAPKSQLEQFGDSIKPNTVVKEFLYGNCGAKLADCQTPTKLSHPGVLNQFDFFRRDLESQSKTFGDSINSFVAGIPAPPATADATP
jgi:hypothetical protein